MPEVICDTSALQYLYQLEMLWVLEALAKHIVVPPAVVEELAVGRSQAIQLPDPTSLEWVTVRAPAGAAVLPLVTDLGPGETEVLALALESSDALVILDDGLARWPAGPPGGIHALDSLSWHTWLVTRCESGRTGESC